MAFDEVQFPTDMSFGAVGGPSYSTDVVQVESGHEARNQNWSVSLMKWDCSHNIKTTAQIATLLAFFRARKGKARAFRFKDWTDYQATAEPTSPATGTGALTTFQLQKTYTSGAVSEARTITKPVSGTVTIYENGVAQPGVTINTATGVVTFSVAPANGVAITASFQFDVPVRFDTDDMKLSIDSVAVHSWGTIPIVEVRDIA